LLSNPAPLTAHKEDLANLALVKASVLHALDAGVDGALDQVADNALKLGARELHVHVLGAGLVHGDVGQVNVGLGGGGELNLGLLRGLAQALHGHAVLGEVNALLALKLLDEVGHKRVVKVLAAEKGVAVGGLDLKDAVLNLENGDIKGAAAQVVDGHKLVLLPVHAVGQCGGGGLVDDAEHVEAGDFAGVARGLALAVVEVSGHGDDGVGHLGAKVRLGGLLHLHEDKRTNLRGGVLFAAGLLRGGERE
jgi:hypothetical protein